MVIIDKPELIYRTRGQYSASIVENMIELRVPFSTMNRDLCRDIPGRIGRGWNRQRRCWQYHLSHAVVTDIIEAWDERILDADLRVFWAAEDMPDPVSNTSLWRHQLDAFRRLYPLRGGLIAFDMGTGKTAEAITLLDAWQARKVLVLGPRSVLSVWPPEFARHSPRKWRIVFLKEGAVSARTRKAKLELSRTTMGAIAFVINYEAAIRPEFRDWSLGQTWDAVIFDEVHHLKSPGGVQSRYAYELSKRATRRLGLTGTPIPHSFPDVYGQCRCLDPGVFGTSFARFRGRFCVMGGFQGHEVIGLKNRREFERRLGAIMVRVTKDDVFDLPPVITETRTGTLCKRARKVYDQLAKEFYAWVEAGQEVTIQNALVKLMRLHQITSGFVVTDNDETIIVGDEKRQLFGEYLDDLPIDEPIVVFCRFLADVYAAKEIATKQDRAVSLLCGGVDEFSDWQNERTNVLVCQIQAGAEGLDMTRASQMCFYSLGFSLAQHEQAKARLDRAGQTRPVTNTYLVIENTLDEKILKAIQKREEIVTSILQGARSMI